MRPINNVNERSTILAQFDFVDYIIIFDDDTPFNLLKNLNPSVLVKGGDYKKEQIIGAEYADNVILFNFIENKSSSLVIKKICQQEQQEQQEKQEQQEQEEQQEQQQKQDL